MTLQFLLPSLPFFVTAALLWLALARTMLKTRSCADRERQIIAVFVSCLPLRFLGRFFMPRSVLMLHGTWQTEIALHGRLFQAGLFAWACTGANKEELIAQFNRRLEQEGNEVIDAMSSYLILPNMIIMGLLALALWQDWSWILMDELIAAIAFVLALGKAALMAYLLETWADIDKVPHDIKTDTAESA